MWASTERSSSNTNIAPHENYAPHILTDMFLHSHRLHIKHSQTWGSLLRAIRNQESHCLLFPLSTSWSLHLNCNPISCRGLWKLVSKPLRPSSLWVRTAKVLRGADLEDLFSRRMLSFFIFSFCFSSFVTFLPEKGPQQTNLSHS